MYFSNQALLQRSFRCADTTRAAKIACRPWKLRPVAHLRCSFSSINSNRPTPPKSSNLSLKHPLFSSQRSTNHNHNHHSVLYIPNNSRLLHRPYSTLLQNLDPSNNAALYSAIGLCVLTFLYEAKLRVDVKSHQDPKLYKPFTQNFVCNEVNVREGRWWVFLTSSFAHGNILHLGVNMYILMGWGPLVLQLFGSSGFVGLWVAGALGCSGGHIWWERLRARIRAKKAQTKEGESGEATYGGAIGSSGAIAGMTAAIALAYPQAKISLLLLGGSYPIRAATAGFAGGSAACLLTDFLPAIGHAGHLGGMAGAALYALAFLRGRFL